MWFSEDWAWSTITLLFPLHNNWSSQIGILRMTEVAFLLFTLVLNFGQATTCEADTCQGECYLENHGLFLKPGTKISVSRTVFKTGLTISGGFGTETNIETFPVKVNCAIPPFPAPGISYMLLMSSSRCTLQGRRYHSLSVIKSGDLVACGGFFTRKSCISWRIGQAGWIEFANLRFLYFNSSLLLTISFSQERSYHATVVTQNDTLIIFGGDRSSTTGEIVKSEFPKLYLILLRIQIWRFSQVGSSLNLKMVETERVQSLIRVNLSCLAELVKTMCMARWTGKDQSDLFIYQIYMHCFRIHFLVQVWLSGKIPGFPPRPPNTT